MNDRACVAFLQWALPRLGMRWKGFRKVRRQVCRRIRKRITELGLDGPDAYRRRLEGDPEEWSYLAFLCRVTISRFARDQGVYRFLGREALPALAAETEPIRAWSAGCASGEEPYTLKILWTLEVAPKFPGVEIRILGTDLDPVLLERARRAVYPRGTLRELDPAWIERAFRKEGEAYRLREEFREGVRWIRQDLRTEVPSATLGAPFHLILCRNLAFTYFDEEEQRRILAELLDCLEPGGVLVLGAHETLPAGDWPLERWSRAEPVFRKEGSAKPRRGSPHPPGNNDQE